jgi:hypothetical protein
VAEAADEEVETTSKLDHRVKADCLNPRTLPNPTLHISRGARMVHRGLEIQIFVHNELRRAQMEVGVAALDSLPEGEEQPRQH